MTTALRSLLEAEQSEACNDGALEESDKLFTTIREITAKKTGAVIPLGTKVRLVWDGQRAESVMIVAPLTGIRTATTLLHKTVKGVSKEPSLSTLEKWGSNGIAKSVLGAKVEPDGWDADGSPSWMLAVGVI
jgi:hypothetical protein